MPAPRVDAKITVAQVSGISIELPARAADVKRRRTPSSDEDSSSTSTAIDFSEPYHDDDESIAKENSKDDLFCATHNSDGVGDVIPAAKRRAFVASLASPILEPLSRRPGLRHENPIVGKDVQDPLQSDGALNGQPQDRGHAPQAMSEDGDQAAPIASRRGQLPDRAIRHLKSWFWAHRAHPYPSEEQKLTLIAYTGLSRGQLNNWFTNARRRLLPRGPADPSLPDQPTS